MIVLVLVALVAIAFFGWCLGCLAWSVHPYESPRPASVPLHPASTDAGARSAQPTPGSLFELEDDGA